METVLITGGSGMIGTRLTSLLAANNYRVIILSRKKRPDKGNVSYSEWDINAGKIDNLMIAQVDHIVHLAGAGVADKRWTKKRKQEIINSRVKSAALLVKSLTETTNKVKSVVTASGIGWYGPDKKGGHPFKENEPAASDFLGTTCKLWEESLFPVRALGKKLVIVRTGIVLSNDGGAFPEFEKPMKAGVATILGDGKQVVSWIHIDDLCRIYMDAIQKTSLQGVYNAVAPEPISNKQLMLTIARMRKRPFIPIHVPEFVLKVVLGELSIEILKSATVDGSKIRGAGFNFIFPGIEAAANDLLHKR
jgi:uncharacterized protein (TIGR01777 family)